MSTKCYSLYTVKHTQKDIHFPEYTRHFLHDKTVQQIYKILFDSCSRRCKTEGISYPEVGGRRLTRLRNSTVPQRKASSLWTLQAPCPPPQSVLVSGWTCNSMNSEPRHLTEASRQPRLSTYLPKKKTSQYPLDRRFGRSNSRPGHHAEENLWQESNPYSSFVQPVAYWVYWLSYPGSSGSRLMLAPISGPQSCSASL